MLNSLNNAINDQIPLAAVRRMLCISMLTPHCYAAILAFLTLSISPNIYASSKSFPSTKHIPHDVLQIAITNEVVYHVLDMQTRPKDADYKKKLEKFNSQSKQQYADAIQKASSLLDELKSYLQSFPLQTSDPERNDKIYAVLVHEEPEIKWLLDSFRTILPSKAQQERKWWKRTIIEQKARPVLTNMTIQQHDQLVLALEPLVQRSLADEYRLVLQ